MGTGPEKSGVIVSEIMKDKLYFAPLNRPEDSAIVHRLPKPASGFNIDNELVNASFTIMFFSSEFCLRIMAEVCAILD
jgi:hypothetical protein